MMREQIRLKPDKSSKLDRRTIRQRQLIDDRKTDGITQRGVTGRSQLQRSLHPTSIKSQGVLSQY